MAARRNARGIKSTPQLHRSVHKKVTPGWLWCWRTTCENHSEHLKIMHLPTSIANQSIPISSNICQASADVRAFCFFFLGQSCDFPCTLHSVELYVKLIWTFWFVNQHIFNGEDANESLKPSCIIVSQTWLSEPMLDSSRTVLVKIGHTLFFLHQKVTQQKSDILRNHFSRRDLRGFHCIEMNVSPLRLWLHMLLLFQVLGGQVCFLGSLRCMA